MSIIREQYIRRKCDPVEAERIWSERGGVKACTVCSLVKPREQFRPTSKNKDGHHPECKSCRNEADKQRRWAKGSVPLEEYNSRIVPADYSDATWRTLEVKNAHDAWTWWLAHAPAWWLDARERWRREMQLGWWLASTHRRRAADLGSPVGDVDGRAMTAMMTKATCCHWCGEAMTRDIYSGVTKWTDATYDHVVPLSEGGAHSIENIVIAHAGCNYSRDGRAIRFLSGELCS